MQASTSLMVPEKHLSRVAGLNQALQGLGIALLPDFIVADALADGRLVRVLEGRERSPLTLSVLYPSRQHVPAKTRLFIDHMVSQFA